MQSAEIKSLIETALPGCRIEAEGEGCNFRVMVVSEAFAGLSPLMRQQQVLRALREVQFHCAPAIGDLVLVGKGFELRLGGSFGQAVRLDRVRGLE
jgi:acid stress-induced BolA-like protein IbaG/YrbA